MKINTKAIELEMARQGMTYSGLAQKAGMSSNGFTLVRNRQECSPRSAGKIASALGVKVEQITDDTRGE